MITYEDLNRYAEALLAFCGYPAVQYKVKLSEIFEGVDEMPQV